LNKKEPPHEPAPPSPPAPPEEQPHLLPLETARDQLAWIWFIGCAALLLLFAGETLGTVYSGKAQQRWSWAVPSFMPTLGLIGSVLAANAIIHANAEREELMVRKSFFRLSRGVTIFYLVLLLGSAIAMPLIASSRDGFDALGGLGLSNYWLSPVQTLVVAFTSALFFTKEKKQGASRSARRGK
jgi:hypothetical protein